MFPGVFLNFIPMSFDITSVASLRQTLVSVRVSSGLQQSVATFHSFLPTIYGELGTVFETVDIFFIQNMKSSSNETKYNI